MFLHGRFRALANVRLVTTARRATTPLRRATASSLRAISGR